MKFDETPFGIPVNEPLGPQEQLYQKANKVFSASFKFQMDCRATNCCSFINIMLRRCLRSLGFKTNGLLHVQYGRFWTNDKIVVPHVWLDIGGYVIDNTYVEDIPLETFIQIKKMAKYVPFAESHETSDCFLGDEGTRAKGIPDHDLKAFEWFLNTSNEDKYMALSANKVQLSEYQARMMKFMKETFDVQIPEAKKEKVCWNCDKVSESLKSCSKCKVAQYCNKDCQRTDWRKIHKRVCLPPHTS